MNDSDLPLKQEHCNMFLDSDSQMASRHDFNHALKGNSSDGCLSSAAGLEPPSAGSSSGHTDGVAGDIDMVKSINPSSDLSRVDVSREAMHSRNLHWPHLYKLAAGSKGKSLLGDPLSLAKNKLMKSVREGSGRDNINALDLRPKRPAGEAVEDSAHLMNGKCTVNTESTLLSQSTRSKMLAMSGFSHFFGKKNPKGKGIIYEQPEVKGILDTDVSLQNPGKLVPVTGATSETASGRNVKAENITPEDNVGIGKDSTCDGISLREWLKAGRAVMNKVERLNLFRQIAELVDFAHSEGLVLRALWPSYLILTNSNEVKYMGSTTQVELGDPVPITVGKKRPLRNDIQHCDAFGAKRQKLFMDMKCQGHHSPVTLRNGSRDALCSGNNLEVACSSSSVNNEHGAADKAGYRSTGMPRKPILVECQLEEKWYTCPEEFSEKNCSVSSNIYSLGVLLFELLCNFDSSEAHSAAMLDIHYRILPPFFLSECPEEAGFCLWLIHPDPSSRPTIREILQSNLICALQDYTREEAASISNDIDSTESEVLLDFLISLKERKQDHAAKLVEDVRCVESDIEELKTRPLCGLLSVPVTKYSLHEGFLKSAAKTNENEAKLTSDFLQLEKAYFSLRSRGTEPAVTAGSDRDLLNIRERCSQVQNKNDCPTMNQKPYDRLETFFEGLCKFTRYSKFELRGTLRNADLLNNSNAICSLCFDRDEDYIAVAGASKRIKIFELSSLVNEKIDIHYPAIEMGNKSKLSCISWNSYIKNYLASTDYDGVVQIWDTSSGMGFLRCMEHQKRAWSVDFSQVDPTMLASGSDDCSVKLWNTNETRSACTIWNPANICCVQFSPYSSYLLMFGSADYKIYGYDLRNTRIPWCTFSGHEKAVSYLKFVDSGTLVSASTDNTLKLWDLKKTSISGLSSNACSLTFSGHTNKKHFVGLSVRDGYIACGSENNEVFSYYKSLAMPITSYNFGSINPVSGRETGDDNGQFVSSVCWRRKSDMLAAANSSGSVRLLQLIS